MVIVFGVLTAGTLLAQLLRADTTSSKTETALFGILQFVFSLAFGWLLTRVSAKQEFEESQKQFAIAAYRRIREIDTGVERLLLRLRQQIGAASDETVHELEVLMAIAAGIRSSTKSSIADWGDVIGAEIVTVERIMNLRSEQESLLDTRGDPKSRRREPNKQSTIAFERIEANQQRLEALLESLPYSLRIMESDDTPVEWSVLSEVERIRDGLSKEGFVDLRCYNDTYFPHRIGDVPLGAAVVLRPDDAGARVGIITASTKEIGPLASCLTQRRGITGRCSMCWPRRSTQLFSKAR